MIGRNEKRDVRGGLVAAAAALAVVTLWSPGAAAYVGPGAGLSLLSSLWWLLVAVLTAIGIVLYWPIKVLIRRLRARLRGDGPKPSTDAGDGSDPSPTTEQQDGERS